MVFELREEIDQDDYEDGYTPFLRLYRDGVFQRQWWRNSFYTDELIEEEVSTYVANSFTSRRPGIYAKDGGVLEAVSRNGLAEESVLEYAFDFKLTDDIRRVFGGNVQAYSSKEHEDVKLIRNTMLDPIYTFVKIDIINHSAMGVEE